MNKFLITTLCMVFLIGIGRVCALEEFSPRAVEVDEFIKANLSEYTMQKRIPLEGIGRDYAVAKESGNIVAITENDDHYNVYYFDIEGNELWKKEIHEVDFYGNLYKMTCCISDNGETISLHIATENYYINNTILSNDGMILFAEILKGTKLIPSPDGQYLYKRTGQAAEYWQSNLDIYKNDGTLVPLKEYGNNTNVRIRILSDENILAYFEEKEGKAYSAYIKYLKLENETLTEIWDYEIAFGQNLAYDFDLKTRIDNNILICGNKLYVLDFSGELLYFEDTPYQSYDFVNENEIFLQTHTAEGEYSKLLNLSSKQSKKGNISLRYEKYLEYADIKINKYDEFNNVFDLNDMLVFSIERYPHSDRKFKTIIIFKDDWSNCTIIDPNMDIVSVNDTNFVVFEKYNDNPELIIMQGGKK